MSIESDFLDSECNAVIVTEGDIFNQETISLKISHLFRLSAIGIALNLTSSAELSIAATTEHEKLVVWSYEASVPTTTSYLLYLLIKV